MALSFTVALMLLMAADFFFFAACCLKRDYPDRYYIITAVDSWAVSSTVFWGTAGEQDFGLGDECVTVDGAWQNVLLRPYRE